MVTQWLIIVNKMKHYELEKGGHILSILNITNFTQKDGGNYSCMCCYDRNTVTTKNDLISNQMSVVIYAEGMHVASSMYNIVTSYIIINLNYVYSYKL